MAKRCDTHRKQHLTVDLTLLSLLTIGFGLLVWHVWAYGPEQGGKAVLATEPFWRLVLLELWGLISDGHGIVAELGDVWLYFLIGIMIAGYIRTYKLHIRLRKTLIRYGFLSIFIAAVIGVFSPLCSCGILATVIGLLSSGLPLAPAMALLIASPLMSPTAFFLTISDLGGEWAFIRVLVAFLMGVFAGVVTHLIRNKGFQTETLFIDGGIAEGDFHDSDYGDERLRCTCREKFSNRIAAKHPHKGIIFCAKTLEMSWMVGKYVLVGIAVGSVAERYIPQEFMANLFGRKSALNIVWVTLGSIPIFMHQVSASSILFHIKEALPGTLDKGAGLALLIGGPVTAIPAMTLLWAMFKKRVFVLYMAISILGTILFAYMFSLLIFVPNIDAGNPLLRGVGALPSGEASVLVKSHEYVHMVADPGGKGMIAIFEDLEGGSGVVFDSSLLRFMNASLDKEDNKRYLKNIANWLEETASGEAAKKILVYNTYSMSGSGTKAGYDQSRFNGNIPKVLPYKLMLTDRLTTPQITPELLKDYSQLWIINGGIHTQGVFGEQEVAAILDFRDLGGSLLLAAGPRGANGDFTRDVNQIASSFGVTFQDYHLFEGHHGEDKVLPVSITGNFFNEMAQHLLPYYNSLRRWRDASPAHEHAD